MSATYKIIKNTTISDIDLEAVGLTMPANGSYTVEATEILLWATDDAIAEITPFINSGDIVINDGAVDLSAADGIRFLKYADRSYIQQEGVDIVRANTVLNFEGTNVTVTDEGDGKATVSIIDTSSDGLYSADCIAVKGCAPVATSVAQLVDSKLCFLISGECE